MLVLRLTTYTQLLGSMQILYILCYENTLELILNHSEVPEVFYYIIKARVKQNSNYFVSSPKANLKAVL